MSHRRAKRIRKMLSLQYPEKHPGRSKAFIQVVKQLARHPKEKLPTLKELHKRANVHADIPDPKPTGIL
jgi:hypothetical protein